MSKRKEKQLIDLVESCDFVPATALIPRSWDSRFWEAISENAPFSWGDNNRSLVDFRSFLNHAEEALECAQLIDAGARRWLNKMNKWCDEAEHGPVYIDLEN